MQHTPYSFDANATYVIAGGLGGLGKSTASWMVSKGARNLALLSRRGKAAATQEFLASMHASGVKIFAPPCDIGDRGALARVLAECAATMPPIKGCIQAAMDLQVSPPSYLVVRVSHSASLQTSRRCHTSSSRLC